MGKTSKLKSTSVTAPLSIDPTLSAHELITKHGLNPQLIIEAAKTDKHFLIDVFVASGIDINSRDTKGNTALHHATKNLSFSSIWKLISLGADTTIKSAKGNLAESSLKYNSFKITSNPDRENNEAIIKNCKILFKIAKYVDYIILPKEHQKLSFSKDDSVVTQDVKFFTLAIHKLTRTMYKKRTA